MTVDASAPQSIQTATAAKLVTAAAHLFARQGIEAVPLRDVGERAGQRNASAVQYHFGGRWDLVTAVLGRHGDAVAGWSEPTALMSLEEIVEGLVALLRPKLDNEEGRDFLRIVFELMSRYPGRWDEDPQANVNMTSLVARIVELLAPMPPAIARARAIAVTQFVSYQMAERARLVDEGVFGILSEDTFVTNLTEMSIAMLAPSPTTRSRTPRL